MRELPNFIEGMSLQAIFDTAYIRTMRQGSKCADDFGRCAYRNAHGEHCAIGHLMVGRIPESHWVWRRTFSVGHLVKRLNLELQVGNLLVAIQKAHDETLSNFCPSFCSNMEWVAAEFDLDFNANLHLEEDY